MNFKFNQGCSVNREKMSVDEIRARFDADVERFSNLETGQSATMDAPLVLELLTQIAAAHAPGATSVLDIGCGAGNYTLKLLEKLPGLACTLIDLSLPMLTRAKERVEDADAAQVDLFQADVRNVELPGNQFDIVLAGAVRHHLRDETQWQSVMAKIHAALRPGGIFLVSDLVEAEIPAVRRIQQERYANYLRELRDDAYRQTVFDYIEREDTPRSVAFQLEMCRRVGFSQVDVIHAQACFGAYAAVK